MKGHLPLAETPTEKEKEVKPSPGNEWTEA